jgi:hypothetical protein
MHLGTAIRFAFWGVIAVVIVAPVALVGAIKAAVFWENWKEAAAQLAQDTRLGCHVDGLDPVISNDGSVSYPSSGTNQFSIPVYSAYDIRQKWMFSVPPCVGADSGLYTDVPPPVRVRTDAMRADRQ